MTSGKKIQLASSVLCKAGLRRRSSWALLACAFIVAASGWAAERFDSVYISEFLAENHHILQDDEGNYSGWIELYNGGPEVVDLAGWFLSDTRTNLAKWR